MTGTIGPGPDPNQIYPMHPYNELVFLKNFIKASNIHIGDSLTVKIIINKYISKSFYIKTKALL